MSDADNRRGGEAMNNWLPTHGAQHDRMHAHGAEQDRMRAFHERVSEVFFGTDRTLLRVPPARKRTVWERLRRAFFAAINTWRER